MTIDKEKLTFHFERMLDATPGDAFDAWTKPEELSEWWDPDGRRLVSCAIDLRVGGTFTLKNAGHAPPFSGVYTVLDRPKTIAFEANGSIGTVKFEAAGDRTRMNVSIKSPSREHFEMFTKLAIYEGTQRTFDNLMQHFASRAPKA
ncbi:MAG: SRPBCC domain-containing protein [Archangium sp.]